MQRASVDASASLQAAEDALAQGECVVIFPEGTISLDLDPTPGKSGAARLAAATGVKITPVGLWGAQRIMFKGRKPVWRAGVAESVVVGAPVRVARDDDITAATGRMMHEIASSVARARRIYPHTTADTIHRSYGQLALSFHFADGTSVAIGKRPPSWRINH